MEYNLNLTKDYCAHWTVANAIRELIANTLDEDGYISAEASPVNDGKLLIDFSTPRPLPVEAFLMGYSVKHKEVTIGQYGEGLKLAILVLLRENIPFMINTATHSFQFEFKTPPGMGVETLHMYMDEDYDDVEGTIISVEGIEPDDLYNQYIEDAKSSKVLPNRQGLYCQGMLVDPEFYVSSSTTRYGVNLNKPIKLNRDRTSYEHTEDIAEVLEVFDPSFFIEGFDSNMSEYAMFSYFSDDYKQRIAKAFAIKKYGYTLEAIGNKRIIFAYDSDVEYQKHKDYIVLQWYLGKQVLNTSQDNQMVSQLRIKFDGLTDYTPTTDYAKDMPTEARRRYDQLKEELVLTTSLPEMLDTLLKYIPMNRQQRAHLSKVIKDHLDNGFEVSK